MHFKRIIRSITTLALSVTLALALAACGGAENEPEPVEEEEYEEEYEDYEEQPLEDEDYEEEEYEEEEYDMTSDEPSYVSIYRALVVEMSESGEADQFILAMIDDDEIPELLASNSEEPYGQDNTFIYTVYNDEPVLLASVIAGQDGASLSYSESNLIRLTGSLAGMADVYYTIVDGGLEEVFRAEMTNADGGDDFVYSLDGEEVSEDEYEKELAAFNEEYAPFVGIDYDGLSIMEFKNGEFEVMHQMAYWTAEDTLDELDSLATE